MEPIDYCIRIYCPDNLLLFAIFLSFLSAMAIGRMMLNASKFVMNKKGQRLSIIELEMPKTFARFTDTLANMTAKAKEAVRLNLILDFFFMPCLYLCMFFVATYVKHRLAYNHSVNDVWICALSWVRLLPFLTWALDITENMFTLSLMRQPNRRGVIWMKFFSIVKWLSGFLYVLYFIMLAVIYLLTKNHLAN
ncbi:hypothetical protein [Pinibacter aurantiacus]|uniref:Uncharacterized protein n=1 Tax=Pinibacter aurantiacus TaxID=2851599 RepID=A0A9E2SB35_9BACT|nr:hypothetical protein [Pinibacter aurantiacus]MBV4359291.1 hypothetical protein [Pinibacter aurantiacus]